MPLKNVDMKLSKIKNVTPVEYTAFVLIHRLIESLGRKVKNACEVGCGDGDFLLFFEDYNIPILGIDVSKESVTIAKEKVRSPHVEIQAQDIVELKRHFDIVFALNVLEHVEHDDASIGTLSKIADWLVITVPAHKRLYSKFDKNVGHVRRYDRQELLSLLEKHNFKVEQIYSIGSILFHIYANLFYKDKKLSVEGVREFNKFSAVLIKKINIIHKVFFLADMILKKFDFGIVYYILAKNESRK